MNSKCPLLLILISMLWISALTAQDKRAYQLYQMDGKSVSFAEMTERAAAADLIFFGELHNNAIAHWLQIELIMELAADTSKQLAVGMEMFEADQQVLLDEYSDSLISRSSFENEARLWPNYKTDYQPIVTFTVEQDVKLIATNIPRRYASAVYSSGLKILDALSADAKKWIAPLPIEVDTSLPGYKNILEAAHGHGGDNLIYSQAVKDATMAHFILAHLDENSRMVHLNGAYHSNNFEGIVWYINQQNNGLNILTINTLTAKDITDVNPDDLKKADITLVVDSRVTKTH